MKTKKVKKSLDIPVELDGQLQKFIDCNEGTTFSLIAIQALRQWLEDPKIEIKIPANKEKKGTRR